MIDQNPGKLNLLLGAHEGVGRIHVELGAFLKFSREMSRELRHLAADWNAFAPLAGSAGAAEPGDRRSSR